MPLVLDRLCNGTKGLPSDGWTGMAANLDYFCGALIVTFSIIALSGVLRVLRWLNLPVALCLVVVPWFVDGVTLAARWNDLAVGICVLLLSLPRGRIKQRFGGWNKFLV